MPFYAWYSQKQAESWERTKTLGAQKVPRPVVWTRDSGEEVIVTKITSTPDTPVPARIR